MKLTLDDLARLSGLSRATVSRALSGRGSVSGRAAAKVHRLARDHGYAPHGMARALARGHREAFGVVWPSDAASPNPFVSLMVAGAQDHLDEDESRNLMLMRWRMGGNAVPKMVREHWVDGVLVAISAAPCPLQIAQALERLRLPGVVVNDESDRLPSVCCDDTAAAAQAVDYLYRLGHRRIAYVGAPATKNQHPSTVARLKGYQQACRQRGLAVVGDVPHIEGITARTNALLASTPPPTALVCYSDVTSEMVLHELMRRGVRVPGDMSIIGFDNARESREAFVPLSTMEIPFRKMGRRAAEMLEDLIEHPDDGTPNVVLRARLIERASMGPAPEPA